MMISSALGSSIYSFLEIKLGSVINTNDKPHRNTLLYSWRKIPRIKARITSARKIRYTVSVVWLLYNTR